jgi:hypothetical protein
MSTGLKLESGYIDSMEARHDDRRGLANISDRDRAPQSRDAFNANALNSTKREKLQVSISRPNPDGSEETLVTSEPCRGGNHIRLIFSSFHELFGLGFEPEDLAGVLVRTFTNGKQETCVVCTEADIRLAFEQYQRTLVS